ncbi:MAG: TOBE domain-containing protein, partial [Pseudomonadota bacterium]
HSTIVNILPATVTEIRDDGGAHADVLLDLNGQPLLARITRRSVRALGVAPGLAVFAQVKSVAVR